MSPQMHARGLQLPDVPLFVIKLGLLLLETGGLGLHELVERRELLPAGGRGGASCLGSMRRGTRTRDEIGVLTLLCLGRRATVGCLRGGHHDGCAAVLRGR